MQPTHEELKGAFPYLSDDADRIYPGWKEAWAHRRVISPNCDLQVVDTAVAVAFVEFVDSQRTKSS